MQIQSMTAEGAYDFSLAFLWLRPNQFMSNHLIDVQQIKNVYNTQTIDKTWLTEYQVPFYKSTFCK